MHCEMQDRTQQPQPPPGPQALSIARCRCIPWEGAMEGSALLSLRPRAGGWDALRGHLSVFSAARPKLLSPKLNNCWV